MTFDELLKQLTAIDREAVSILKATGFHPLEGLGSTVQPLRDSAEDIFLREQAENLLESLALLHQELCYLKSPACEECRVEPFPDGRYGFFSKDGRKHILSCGRSIEAKIQDRYGRQRWVRSRIEHDGSDYFLWGHMELPLSGLTVREREVYHDL